PAFPHALCDVLLSEPVYLEQLPVGLCLLEGRQLLALQVLDQRELEALGRVGVADDDRDLTETGQGGGPQTSLARDELVVSSGATADHHGLQDPVSADGGGERGAPLEIEP